MLMECCSTAKQQQRRLFQSSTMYYVMMPEQCCMPHMRVNTSEAPNALKQVLIKLLVSNLNVIHAPRSLAGRHAAKETPDSPACGPQYVVQRTSTCKSPTASSTHGRDTSSTLCCKPYVSLWLQCTGHKQTPCRDAIKWAHKWMAVPGTQLAKCKQLEVFRDTFKISRGGVLPWTENAVLPALLQVKLNSSAAFRHTEPSCCY